MLGIHGIGRDRAGYYLSDLALELPVAGPGCWAGSAAHRLGLDGPVAKAEFTNMLEGRQPRSGTMLGSGRTSVAAFDLTFSAPKSVSVLFALTGAEGARVVVAAHREAVGGALSYLEQHGLTATRRSGADRRVVSTSGALAAVFTHGVSRAGDPHVHSHVVVANLVHGADGRWSACDRRGLAAHRGAASAVYEAHLRSGLTATMGLHWSASPGRGAEVDGVGPELLAQFSGRSADIRRHVYEHGVRTGRGARVAWAATRPAKAPGVSFADLAVRWQQRARDVGGHLPPARPGAPGGHAVLDEHRFAGLLSRPAHGGAHRRDVVSAFAGAAHDGATASTLDRLVAQWIPPGPPGVAEPLQQRRAVVPANHHLRALGPRPVDPDEHALWLRAVRIMDGYRERWGLTREPEPFGVAPSSPGLGALPADRLADHVRAERVVVATRARLGRREPMTVELGLGR